MSPLRPLPLLLVLLAGAGPGAAQIPETFENLEVLPADIPRSELIGIMRGYAGALGVRCIHCHVGDDPNDLEGVDFASDEREPKRVARQMMRMVDTINRDLMPATGRTDPITIGCTTCHRGVERPEELTEVLRRTIEKDGLEAAETTYRDLRARYYGRAAYDFGPPALNHLAEVASRAGEVEKALFLSALNLEFHGADAYSHFLRAQILRFADDLDGARASIERALELDPENEFYKGVLEKVRAPAAAAGSR